MKTYRKLSMLLITPIMLSLLAGCANKDVAVPELIEPVAIRDSYRPVQYGDVANIVLRYATVTPNDHPFFWITGVTIEGINVKVGDYVEEGTVLASAEIGNTEKEIFALKEQIKYENELYQVMEEKYFFKHQELEFASTVAYEAGQKDAVEAYAKQIAELEENQKYEKLLHEYRLDETAERICEKEKLTGSKDLVADYSGYVTYIKDISINNQAAAEENIIVVSDYNDCYLEMQTMDTSTLGRGSLEQYQRIYTEFYGKRYYLEEYDYNPQEKIMIENKSMYPKLRFKLKEEAALPPIGADVPVFMTIFGLENVLRVGTSSLYEDKDGYFVYVKEGDSRIAKHVEIGRMEEDYTEIVSGLEEGEMVCYTTTNMMPENYRTYEVVLDDYHPMNQTKNYKESGVLLSTCYSKYSGYITEVYKKEGDVVKVGDVICKVQTDAGSARLKDLQDQILALDEEYNLTLMNLEKQSENSYQQKGLLAAQFIKERDSLQAQIDADKLKLNSYQNQGQTGTQETDCKTDITILQAQIAALQNAIDTLTRSYSYQQKQVELRDSQRVCDSKTAEINHRYQKKQLQDTFNDTKKNNNGKGITEICADADGVLGKISLTPNLDINRGEQLFYITQEEKTFVQFTSDSDLSLGQEILYVSEDGSHQFKGKVVGRTAPDKVYVSEKDGKVYITTNSADLRTQKFQIRLENPAFYEEKETLSMNYGQYDLYGVAVVPNTTVQSELVENEEHLFVWQMIDDRLVKQYVTRVDDTIIYKPDECIIIGVKPGDVLAVEE